ncbi:MULTISPECIES: fimbrial protein [Serratia]|uniref:fimbrial protein n=1 Tax=Serratia TaxID=613 RepID=UPI001F4BD9DF|nr:MULTISPECIES: fimbrial protein [Serratia]ULG10888.1 fimbrial protein [Serratia entomophila]CAI1948977.1 putative minor fimbrial subunit StfF [Serratia quinivorans]CAI2158827.1 putative minor fimbrial subunit StfF [Serratia quinivorans]
MKQNPMSGGGPRWLLVLAVLAGGMPATAAENMRFYGTLISPPPCTINNGQMIEVNFGDDLLTTKVDGVNYSRPINYTLDCTVAGNKAVRMMIQGTASSFDNSVLATAERTGLAIAVKPEAVDQVLPINSWMRLTTQSAPKLRAVPVRASWMELTPGAFTAGATLLVDYQ